MARISNIYTVRDAAAGNIVARGTVKELSERMHMTAPSVRNMMMDIRYGRDKRYKIDAVRQTAFDDLWGDGRLKRWEKLQRRFGIGQV